MSANQDKKKHPKYRNTFTKIIPSLFKVKSSNKGEYIDDEEGIIFAHYLGNLMEHSEIAELSNEKEETEHNNAKDEGNSSCNGSSNSNESDYIETKQNNSNMKIEISPAADNKHHEVKWKETSDYDVTKIHPFMLEGYVEDRRRKSSAIADREMILSYARVKVEKEEGAVTARDFDENLMMFGGNTVTNKVRVS